MARSYRAGQKHVSEILEDRQRVEFLFSLYRATTNYRSQVKLTEPEQTFVLRIVQDHDKTVPNIHSGDRNICDSLRRRFERRLS
jgi:hypothetical protein